MHAPQRQAAPPPAYHLELEANPAAPFPFLGKFGTITLHVFPSGVRAETFWLQRFGAAAVPHSSTSFKTPIPCSTRSSAASISTLMRCSF